MPSPRTWYACVISRALLCESHLFLAICVEQLQMYPWWFGIHNPLAQGWDAQGSSVSFSQREPKYCNGQLQRNPGGQMWKKCILYFRKSNSQDNKDISIGTSLCWDQSVVWLWGIERSFGCRYIGFISISVKCCLDTPKTFQHFGLLSLINVLRDLFKNEFHTSQFYNMKQWCKQTCELCKFAPL